MDLLELQSPTHLNRELIIASGSFYTPTRLVEEVGRMVAPFIEEKENAIYLDSSVGGGAFTTIMDRDYRLADSDETSCQHLAAITDKNRVFHSNSLHEVSREKYNIPPEAYLASIGNPPYNDTTSAYKKGEKGKNECDEDLFDRDLGISFLKSYDKLESDLVCVLHPLAYLVKEANFKRLKSFRENYRIKDGVIFSSQIFKGTGSKKFPIMIGLYERNSEGMDFPTIQDFNFRLLDNDRTFQLSRFTTTDGYIDKYPARKNDPKESEVGLYYYTFRDTNSLQRSASFQTAPHYNAIVLNVEELYKYAWLFAFRTLFAPEDRWLYGNLSPLVDIDFVEKNKSTLVEYAIAKHSAFREIAPSHLQAIRKHYSLSEGDRDMEEVDKTLRKKIADLV